MTLQFPRSGARFRRPNSVGLNLRDQKRFRTLTGTSRINNLREIQRISLEEMDLLPGESSYRLEARAGSYMAAVEGSRTAEVGGVEVPGSRSGSLEVGTGYASPPASVNTLLTARRKTRRRRRRGDERKFRIDLSRLRISEAIELLQVV